MVITCKSDYGKNYTSFIYRINVYNTVWQKSIFFSPMKKLKILKVDIKKYNPCLGVLADQIKLTFLMQSFIVFALYWFFYNCF